MSRIHLFFVVEKCFKSLKGHNTKTDRNQRKLLTHTSKSIYCYRSWCPIMSNRSHSDDLRRGTHIIWLEWKFYKQQSVGAEMGEWHHSHEKTLRKSPVNGWSKTNHGYSNIRSVFAFTWFKNFGPVWHNVEDIYACITLVSLSRYVSALYSNMYIIHSGGQTCGFFSGREL